MNDKNNGNSVDLKANLDKIASTKPRKRTRKDNIYERFITRVGSTDEDDHTESKSDQLTSWEKTQKPPTYEPLGAEELQFFASLENDQELNGEASSTTSTDISFDFTNEDEVFNNHSSSAISNNNQPSNKDLLDSYNLDEDSNLARDSNHVEHTDDLTATDNEVATPVHNSEIPFKDETSKNKAKAITKEIAKPQGRLASNKKPLIIGIILGTLLATLIVLILNASGILSPSTENIASDTPQNTASSGEKKSSNNVQPDNSPVVKAERSVANNASQNPASQKNVAANGDNNTPSNVNRETDKPVEVTADGSNAEPDITYEDFRKESQSTLYRETDD